MTREFFIFYIEASVVSLVMFGMLLHHDLRTINRSERQIQFDHTLLAFMLYFICDALWACVSSGMIPRNRLTVALTNLTNAVVIALVSYEWLRFTAASEGMPRRDERWMQVAMRLPLEVVSGILILAWIAAPDFWIGLAGEINDLYFILLLLAPALYVLSALGYSLFAASRQKNAAVQRRFVLIGLCPVVVAVLGVLQIIMLNAPVFCLGCAILILYFFLQEAEDQISIDPLTGLNNRGQLLRYVAQEESGRRSDLPTYILMIDANDFKHINDTYGHAEGDRALVLIAETLKEAAATMVPPPFMGRYGGDEFILILHTDDEAVVDALTRRIRESLCEKNRLNRLPYTLAVAIGASRLAPMDTFQSCLELADRRLYQDKACLKQAS